MKYKNQMAKALYDNMPESPEELAFRKGDILTVIEQNTGGLEGWWLCSLHGRQGIAPGNRLKLLITPTSEGNMASTPSVSPNLAHQQQSPRTPQGMYQPTQGCQTQGIYQVPPSQDVYQVPQRSTLAADGMSCKVMTPTRVGQAYIYSPAPSNSQDLYDVPPMRTQGVYDIPAGRKKGKHASPQTQGLYDIPPAQDTRNQGVYDIPPPSQGVYSIPPCKSNSNQDEGNYDFPQPHKKKPEGVYDVPPMSMSKSTHSNYDFPPANCSSANYDIPPSQLNSGASQDLYDVPRGIQQQTQCRERDRNKGIYDVPPPDSRLLADVTDGINRLSFSSTGSSMSTSSSSAGTPADGRLMLDLDSALQKLTCLQQGLESSLSSLHSLTSSPSWRSHGLMEQYANEVRPTMERVRSTLAEFLAFGKGTAANASTLSDPTLHSKLRKQLQRLEDSQQILQKSLENSSGALMTSKQQTKSDELDRFVMVAHTLPDDAKQLVSIIGGNAEMLFRRAPIEGVVHPFTCNPIEEESYSGQTKPFPVVQNSEKCVKTWMEDYDYVHLQGKEEFERHQKELLEKENIMNQSKVKLGQEQLNQFKQLEQEAIKPVDNDITHFISHQHSTGFFSPSDSSSAGSGAHLCVRDQQLLAFYGEQCEQHFVTLLNAVDAFFSSVAAGQPPRIFVAHAKFVILSAHKLVFIGDTLSRQVTMSDVANRVMDSSNILCELLKTVVGSTKMAALHYPNTPVVQEMVDRVRDLSHHAQQFKMQLLQMAAL
ncbi:enhancer of filamentation 1 isoform X1 [Tachysurus fulvidraco]|uniref:enhancer of filamentation 1 isoform X1 n=2 Tax=Tachysurus fulvidraco TaxID=1234273 RepID=UPI000F4FB1CE|nr:enhancer of filamentation 1 isoform X1 [Tachysurus fulvidraco]